MDQRQTISIKKITKSGNFQIAPALVKKISLWGEMGGAFAVRPTVFEENTWFSFVHSLSDSSFFGWQWYVGLFRGRPAVGCMRLNHNRRIPTCGRSRKRSGLFSLHKHPYTRLFCIRFLALEAHICKNYWPEAQSLTDGFQCYKIRSFFSSAAGKTKNHQIRLWMGLKAQASFACSLIFQEFFINRIPNPSLTWDGHDRIKMCRD